MVHWPTRSPFHFSFTRLQARLLRNKFRRSGLKQQVVQVANGDLSCWVGGDGPPLLLLHGFGASALWQFHPQVRALSKHHRLVIPDLLYFGGSTSPKGSRSVSYQAETMCQLMDALMIPKSSVLGLSYGGFVALWMIAQYPERVDRLIISNSPGIGMNADDYQALLKTFQVSHPREVFLPEHPDGIRTLMNIAWHRPPPLPGFALRDAHRNLFYNQVADKKELLNELVGHLEAPSLHSDVYDHACTRVLILWGAHDKVFPVHLAHRMHRALNGKGTLEVFSRSAHAPNLERPRRFNHAILSFLAH